MPDELDNVLKNFKNNEKLNKIFFYDGAINNKESLKKSEDTSTNKDKKS
jgi:hypothetical protein